jgi:hypothetical protein
MNVDPEHIYKRQDGSTNYGKKILAAIALGLGGFGAGYGGGQNMAMQIINSTIDRDIDAQKAMIANKRTAIAGKRTQLGILQNKFKDDLSAIEGAKIDMLQRVKAQVLQVQTQAQSPQAILDARKLSNALDLQINQHEQNMQMQLQAQNLAREQQATELGTQIEQATIPGLEIVSEHIPSKEDQKKAKELRAKATAALSGIEEYRDFVREHGASRLAFGTERAMAEAKYNRALTAMKDYKGMGASLTENELALIRAEIPSPGLFSKTGSNIERVLNDTLRNTNKNLNSQLRTYGYQQTGAGYEEFAGAALER